MTALSLLKNLARSIHKTASPPVSSSTMAASPSEEPARATRANRGGRMAVLIEEEHLDEHGKPKKQQNPRRTTKRKRSSKLKKAADAGSEDGDDDDFFSGESDSSSDNDSDIEEIPNDEMADILPSKTIPQKKLMKPRTSSGPKKKPRPSVTIEDVEDEDLPRRTATSNTSAPPEPRESTSGTKKKKTRNQIYLFYEVVARSVDGSTGDPGDVHYRCYHGNHKILTVKKTMKSNVSGLVAHLKTNFPPMHQLYTVLQARGSPPTPDEIAFAAGKKTLDASTQSKWLKELENTSNNLKKAFAAQQAQAAGPWDQEKFEELITKWVIACDQPFDAVEKPEYIDMMNYAHHPASSIKLPSREGVRRRVMKMGEDTVKGIRKMFDELEALLSISLDAWTSKNGHAFLAIVAHYITNDGHLEELLIDFRELVGEHSGENMAKVVWETLELYGLIGRVIAFVMDNATNNDTLVTTIQRWCLDKGIYFSAVDSRMRCMPHTIHLAAIKLLEGIGALSKAESKKALSRSGNYQDNTTTPLGREHDDAAVMLDDDEEELPEKGSTVLLAITKLRKIIRTVRSSPQRRQAWVKEIYVTMSKGSGGEEDAQTAALMLILDVRTRWSSTHQMLRRALDYRKCIDAYVSRNDELRESFRLTDADWNSITLITSWLKSFRSATTQMSATKSPMLSTTLAIFRGLQDEIKSILRSLPLNTDPRLKQGLLDAHEKLSDYYYKFDESPFYTWAALLDPRISYEGLKNDYASDPELSEYLETSKKNLYAYFDAHYANKPDTFKCVQQISARTRFIGGWVNGLNSRTYFVLLAISFVFLGPRWLSKEFSQVVETPFPCAARVYTPRPSEC
ncbi:putative protein dimerization activity [Lyophyllum shimeji]|uniref:Transposase-like protein n=1 Tax=Lyophyllum shimeji TaxID=47721 RepID=A0A9P3PXW1_LYOSH|nr:putative protein dimerization activity [Lyophyllum shimeji]